MKKTIVVLKVWEEGKQVYFMDFITHDGKLIRNARATIDWHGSSFEEIAYCKNLKPYSFCTYSSYRRLEAAFQRAVFNENHEYEIFRVDDVNKSNSSNFKNQS